MHQTLSVFGLQAGLFCGCEFGGILVPTAQASFGLVTDSISAVPLAIVKVGALVCCTLLVSAVLSVRATPVVAQPRIADRIARDHVENGTQYFDNGQYEDAAREFRSAYEITRQPELLFDIARSLESADDPRGALQAYQEFLAAGAPGIDREILVTRIENLRARVEAHAEPVQPASVSPSSETDSTSSPTSAETERVTVQYETRRGVIATVGPFVTWGAGLAVGGIAIWQAIQASNDIARIRGANAGQEPWSTSLQQAYDRVGGEITTATLLGVMSAVLLAAGSAWMALNLPKDRREVPVQQVWLVPVPSGAVIGLGGAL
jgi:hypothetical protein